MRGALSVRINDGITDRLVTSAVRNLSFRKVANGGHHSASCQLVLPRDTFTDLGPNDRMYIYDARTAKTIWDGYTENPGVQDGPAGQAWDLTAMGGMVLASDQSAKLIYLDRDLGAWSRDIIETSYIPPSARAEVSADPVGGKVDVLLCSFVPGSPITTGNRVAVSYLSFQDTSMEIGGFGYTQYAGKTDANYAVEGSLGSGTTLSTSPSTISASTTATNVQVFVGDNYAGGRNIIQLRIRRSAGGATNIADETSYAAFTNPRVLGRRMDRNGNLLTGLSGLRQSGYVLASWVVEDLVGRLLSNVVDPATVQIDGTTYGIDQLAFKEGANSAQVLDQLSLYEPNFLWEILETGPNGLHKFAYRAWPTTPRYEISVKDGFSQPGGEVDLCNRIAVYWNDPKGRHKVTVVTQSVPALGNRTRDAEAVTLPDGRGSSANAQQIGQMVLNAKNNPPKAATAVVKRPIMDLQTNKMVMPWEIKPGYLARVRETGDDLQLTEMEYVDNDCAANLTLGTPIPTIEQMIAGLSRKGH